MDTPARHSHGKRAHFPNLQIPHLQEQKDTNALTDKLAICVDKVRSLETENANLCQHIAEAEADTSRKLTLYEAELTEVRRVLDSVAMEGNQAKMEVKRVQSENKDLKTR